MDGDAALLSIAPDHLTWVPPEDIPRDPARLAKLDP
jgi:hypothetical protein